MRSVSKLVWLSMALLALPALAQTIDGGQGKSCTVDTDCGDICGWVCDWDQGKICVPAIVQASSVGQSEGWCSTVADCSNCSSQTACTNNFCSPAIFSGSFAAQCQCDTDCTGTQHCDQTLQMCEPAVTSCNYDGECGCGCACVGGSCSCSKVVPKTCTLNTDCDPAQCLGLSCVKGTCVHDEADCLSPSAGGSSSGGSSGSSSGSSSGGSCMAGGSNCTGSPGSCCSGLTCIQSPSTHEMACCGEGNPWAVCQPLGGSSGGTSSGSSSGVSVSASASSGGASSSLFNSSTNGSSVSASGGVSSSSPAASSSRAGSSTGSSGGAPDAGSGSGSGGCSCGAGTGGEALALLALGLLGLVRRRRPVL